MEALHIERSMSMSMMFFCGKVIKYFPNIRSVFLN